MTASGGEMGLLDLVFVLLASQLTFLAIHSTRVYLKDFELVLANPLECHVMDTRNIPSGIKHHKKDFYCITHCAKLDRCKYVQQNAQGVKCLFYETDFQPGENGTGRRGYKHPRGPWQPAKPPTEATLIKKCVAVLLTTVSAKGHPIWNKIMSTNKIHKKFTDCPCAENAENNRAILSLPKLHKITSITVTPSFGNDTVLLRNATLYVGNSSDYTTATAVGIVSDTPQEYTDQVFNVAVTGQFVILHREDSVPLCLCHIMVMGM